MFRHAPSVAAALALAIVAMPARAQDDIAGRDEAVYTTKIRVPSGATFRVYNYNGPIETTVAAGAEVEIRAEKLTQSDGRARAAGFMTVRDGNDVTFCAVRIGHDRCNARGLDHDDWDDDDDDRRGRPPRISMRVAVPKGVQLVVATGNGELTVAGTGAGLRARSGNGDVTVSASGDAVDAGSGNGDIEVSGAGGPVDVRTGNGRIRVRTTTGPVNASTGNGSVDVSMDRLARVEDMEFRSGNGRITVSLPANYQGRIDATTGNGGIESDFPVTVEGRLSPRHLRGRIGEGGARLRLSTGNGSIVLRKSN